MSRLGGPIRHGRDMDMSMRMSDLDMDKCVDNNLSISFIPLTTDPKYGNSRTKVKSCVNHYYTCIVYQIWTNMMHI